MLSDIVAPDHKSSADATFERANSARAEFRVNGKCLGEVVSRGVLFADFGPLWGGYRVGGWPKRWSFGKGVLNQDTRAYKPSVFTPVSV
jgi:hypothetical protein